LETEMTLVERIARMLCWKNGMNPDLTLGGDGVNFLWHEYQRDAIAVIEEFRIWAEEINGGYDTNIDFELNKIINEYKEI